MFLRALTSIAQRKSNSINVNGGSIKKVLSLLCIARIPNPRFTSQSKESLTTPQREFGFLLEPSEKMLGKLMKLGVLDALSRLEDEKVLSDCTKKQTGRAKDVVVEKYDPALRVKSEPLNCTLILTEGDSAKALVVAGLGDIGREYFGV